MSTVYHHTSSAYIDMGTDHRRHIEGMLPSPYPPKNINFVGLSFFFFFPL